MRWNGRSFHILLFNLGHIHKKTFNHHLLHPRPWSSIVGLVSMSLWTIHFLFNEILSLKVVGLLFLRSYVSHCILFWWALLEVVFFWHRLFVHLGEFCLQWKEMGKTLLPNTCEDTAGEFLSLPIGSPEEALFSLPLFNVLICDEVGHSMIQGTRNTWRFLGSLGTVAHIIWSNWLLPSTIVLFCFCFYVAWMKSSCCLCLYVAVRISPSGSSYFCAW